MEIKLSVENIVDETSFWPPEDVIDLIKKLDLQAENWDVTEKLYNHFKKEMEKLPIGESE